MGWRCFALSLMSLQVKVAKKIKVAGATAAKKSFISSYFSSNQGLIADKQFLWKFSAIWKMVGNRFKDALCSHILTVLTVSIVLTLLTVQPVVVVTVRTSDLKKCHSLSDNLKTRDAWASKNISFGIALHYLPFQQVKTFERRNWSIQKHQFLDGSILSSFSKK